MMGSPGNFFISVILVCGLVSQGTTQLVRLIKTKPATGGVTGVLEARTSEQEVWRTICARAKTLKPEDPVPSASCRDLGYRKTVTALVGERELPNDQTRWIEFSSCAPGGSLTQCTPKHVDGYGSSCNVQRRWIWIHCSDPLPTPVDSSVVQCISTPANRTLKIGQTVTFTLGKPNKSDCKLTVIASDRNALLVVKPVGWNTIQLNPRCDLKVAHVLVRTVPFDSEVPFITDYLCGGNPIKAIKASSGRLVLEYRPMGSARDNINITVTAKLRFRCTNVAMEVCMLKSELEFTDPSAGSLTAVVGPSETCPVHFDPLSDVIQRDVGLWDCGTTLSTTVEDYYSYTNSILFTRATPYNRSSNDDLGQDVESLDMRRFSLKCHPFVTSGNFSVTWS